MRHHATSHMCEVVERRMRRSCQAACGLASGTRMRVPAWWRMRHQEQHPAIGFLTSRSVCDRIPFGMRSTPALPPGPRLPRAVQSLIWYRRAQWLLDTCQARFGDMFTLKIADEGEWVITSDPDTIRQVFTAILVCCTRARRMRSCCPCSARLGAAARRCSPPESAPVDAAGLPWRAHAAPRRPDGRIAAQESSTEPIGSLSATARACRR